MNYINTTKSYVLLQKTLKKKIHFSGVGVHNGRAVSMCISLQNLILELFLKELI